MLKQKAHIGTLVREAFHPGALHLILPLAEPLGSKGELQGAAGDKRSP